MNPPENLLVCILSRLLPSDFSTHLTLTSSQWSHMGFLSPEQSVKQYLTWITQTNPGRKRRTSAPE